MNMTSQYGEWGRDWNEME